MSDEKEQEAPDQETQAPESIDPQTEDDYPPAYALDELSPEEASLEEFPSLHGQPDVEVAQRSVDGEKDETDVHRKMFVLVRDEYGTGKGFDHMPNERATVQYMLQHGLRPVGDVSFDGAKNLPDGRSVALAYTVKAVPAVVAENDAAHLVIE